MNKKRIGWIDIARGIGIIFVIYAHLLDGNSYRFWFYAFHMPLFFFLSGMLFKKEKFQTVLKKSSKRLLIPYFSFALIMYILWFFRQDVKNPDVLVRQFLSIFYGNGNYDLMTFNNILWFLPTLFATRMLFTGITKIFTKSIQIVGALITLSIGAYIFSVLFPGIKLPFGFESALTAAVFYGAGYLWYSSDQLRTFIFNHKLWLTPMLLLILTVLGTIDYNIAGHQVDIRLNHLNNYFFLYIDAFSGIFACIAFSKILNTNRILEAIGRNTLPLFAWHPIVFDYLFPFIASLGVVSMLTNFQLFLPTFYTLIAIGIVMLSLLIYNRTTRLLPKKIES